MRYVAGDGFLHGGAHAHLREWHPLGVPDCHSCFARSRWRVVFWSLLGCFALLVADTVFTVTQQLPINRGVQKLDLAHLTNLGQVQQLRDATVQHFHARGLLSISAFVWLACAVVFSLAGQAAVPYKR